MLQNFSFISQQSERINWTHSLNLLRSICEKIIHFFWHYRNSYYPLASKSSCNLRENPNMNEQFFFFFFFFFLLLGDTFQKDPLEHHNKHMSPPPMPLKHGTLWLENMRIFMWIFIFILLYITLRWKGTCYCAFLCYLHINLKNKKNKK